MGWYIIRVCLASLALSCLFSNVEAAFRANQKWLWPNGIVYYRLSSTIKSDERKSSMIKDAMADITEEAPCVSFVNIETDRLNVTGFVDIVTDGDLTRGWPGVGCWCEVGYQGSRQIINLEPDICFESRQIKLRLFHTLGSEKEHQRPDVAETLDIFSKNIIPRYQKYIGASKYDYEDEEYGIFDFNTPYDILSITQYPPNAYAINDSLKTMQSKDPAFHDAFGYSKDFSVIDLVELNLNYRCPLTSELVFEYVNSYMDILQSRRRLDMAKLERQHQTDQEKQKVYQQRITQLEAQVQVDQEQRKMDQERMSKLESLIEKIIASA